MSTIPPLSVRAEQGSPDRKKAAIGSAVGTTVENYDFLAFGTAAALYFGTDFFPSDDPAIGVLMGFLTFGVGFVMRPVGGILGGYLGDRIGRKPVLVGALFVMGISTVLIGFLPTYAQVGILAPILLTLLRLIQGVAFGAEWGGAILMTFEHAPWRRRGAYASIPQIGIPLGVFFANIAFLLSAGLGNEWAWRLPFMLSAVLIVAGMIIRLKVSESPEFEATKASGQIVKNPIGKVIRDDWRTILRVIALRLAQAGGFYVVVTYLISYITTEGLGDRALALTGLTIATGLGCFTCFMFGSLSDKVGRRTIYIVACVGIVLFGLPLFLLVNSAIPGLIVVAYVIGLTILHEALNGTQGAFFSELFPTNTRSSGASLGYQLSAAIAGFIPFIATALAMTIGWGAGAIIYCVVGAIGLIGAVVTRETWGPQERVAVDEAIHAAREREAALEASALR
jgi:MFS family permease